MVKSMRGGRDTLASIEQALQDLKVQEVHLQRELEQANQRRAALSAERLEALRALAALRTHDALADGVIDEADDLSDQVRTILQARAKTITQLEARQHAAEAERDSLVRKLDLLNAAIAEQEVKLDKAGEAARAALASDPAYSTIAERRDSLLGMHEKAKAKADQVARDESAKGAPYRADPLFMYLWNRAYGSSAYQATGLIRFLDDWVASLVHYQDARANFAMLTEISQRLREHARELELQADAQSVRAKEMEASRIREIVGSDLLAELKAAREQQTQNNKELEAIGSELSETGSQLKFYANGEDPSYQRAVQSYAAFLDRESLVKLMSEAFGTRTGEDDRIVRELQRLDRERREIENADETRRQRLERVVGRKQELTRLSENFRRQHYDDIGSVFDDNPDLGDLLERLLRGAITAAEYWAQTRAQQHWPERPGDPWRQRAGLPPFDRSGGGWGGERRGGSRSANDFETGGTI